MMQQQRPKANPCGGGSAEGAGREGSGARSPRAGPGRKSRCQRRGCRGRAGGPAGAGAGGARGRGRRKGSAAAVPATRGARRGAAGKAWRQRGQSCPEAEPPGPAGSRSRRGAVRGCRGRARLHPPGAAEGEPLTRTPAREDGPGVSAAGREAEAARNEPGPAPRVRRRPRAAPALGRACAAAGRGRGAGAGGGSCPAAAAAHASATAGLPRLPGKRLG